MYLYCGFFSKKLRHINVLYLTQALNENSLIYLHSNFYIKRLTRATLCLFGNYVSEVVTGVMRTAQKNGRYMFHKACETSQLPLLNTETGALFSKKVVATLTHNPINNTWTGFDVDNRKQYVGIATNVRSEDLLLQTQTAPHIVESVQKLKDYLSLVYLLRGRICLYDNGNSIGEPVRPRITYPFEGLSGQPNTHCSIKVDAYLENINPQSANYIWKHKYLIGQYPQFQLGPQITTQFSIDHPELYHNLTKLHGGIGLYGWPE